MLTLTNLINNAKCYEVVRQFRWPDGVVCPTCGSTSILKRGKDETQPERQRYKCQDCHHQFDDLSDSIFAGRYQSLRVWVVCLYLMGLNLSNQQIAKELDLHPNDVQRMTHQLRQGMIEHQNDIQLSGNVEFDEVYVTAGHKGNPDAVLKKNAKDVAASSKGFGGVALSKRRNRPF